jgi:arylsulfatase A-like enzyme
VVPGPRGQLVSLLDVHATLLAYVDRAPAPRGPSRSLVPLLQSPPGATLPWRSALFAEVGPEREFATAVVAPPWKLIHDVGRGAWELFHLARDPGEQRNVYNREPAVAEQLRARLAELARAPSPRCGR